MITLTYTATSQLTCGIVAIKTSFNSTNSYPTYFCRTLASLKSLQDFWCVSEGPLYVLMNLSNPIDCHCFLPHTCWVPWSLMRYVWIRSWLFGPRSPPGVMFSPSRYYFLHLECDLYGGGRGCCSSFRHLPCVSFWEGRPQTLVYSILIFQSKTPFLFYHLIVDFYKIQMHFWW